eukprot:TRINITY_DN16297_c0_g1_i1.p1 TRINITY_DN16297_c0_g1~~TRINITY_DN16297_c0_g1_i1.p1  ORF type:complete len:471 (-),score=66.83 TRINITY_DN16297_c0_g1_i1:943-2355(-)
MPVIKSFSKQVTRLGKKPKPYTEVDPVRIEVGMGPELGREAPKYQLEKQEVLAEPLSVNDLFPYVATTFFVARLVRLIILSACFAEGPHSEDGGYTAAVAFAWCCSFTGLLGALLISRRFHRYLDDDYQIPEKVLMHQEPMALGLLAVSFLAEILHQCIALGRFEYFWSTGIVTDKKSGAGSSEPLAVVVIFLHIGGLIGTLIMFSSYARLYIQAWKTLPQRQKKLIERAEAKRRLAASGDSQEDIESGGGPPGAGRKVADEDAAKASASSYSYRQQGRASSKGSAASPSCNAGAAWGPRQAGSARSPSPAGRAEADNQKREGSGTPRRTNRSPSPQGRGPGIFQKPWTPRGDRITSPVRNQETPQSSPKAWYWQVTETGGEWKSVRIIRSSGDGTATIRLPGGQTVQVRMSQLKQRNGDEDPPPQPAAPSPGFQQERPRSAGATPSGGRPPRAPSAEQTPRLPRFADSC